MRILMNANKLSNRFIRIYENCIRTYLNRVNSSESTIIHQNPIRFTTIYNQCGKMDTDGSYWTPESNKIRFSPLAFRSNISDYMGLL